MNRARKGTRNEFRSADFLNKRDYMTVRSSGSHGMFDIIGWYVGDHPELFPLLRLVQSKTNSSYSKSDLEPLRMVAGFFEKNKSYAQVELHDWLPNARTPKIIIIKAKKEDDIELVDL